ncbi:ABC transporter substrate-binding protein [Alsobacter metallidurans]|uniref:ABC transporter substrate-binding protein n=1 Tax=Alsobacter metallidurans TaxID=340221 RepID=A0A917I4J8_9HYPH|nr:iron ABC transporter permease [Alsobacter metallidurans]GGH09681.1 ABC transporter substrate-binding protein [Alsobacter metallidurans]
MTVAIERTLPVRRFAFDWSKPVFISLVLVLGGLVLLPLFWLAYYSVLAKDGSLSLENFRALVTDPTLRKPYAIAMGMALATGALSCLIATPLAWLTARTDLPGRGVVRAFVTASFVTPPFLGAIAWEILAAPNSGILNEIYRWAFGLEQYEYLFDIYTFEGLVFALSCYTFPYVFTLVANALDRVPTDLEEASAMLGGGVWTTLRKVTLPLVLPAMLAGGLVAILQALTMFGTPAILALPAGFHVITTKIWSLFQYPPKPGLAAASALPLLLITVFLIWAQAKIIGRRGYTTVGGKSGAARITPLGRYRWAAVAFVTVVLSITVIMPYLALLKTAVTRTVSEPLTWSSFTLHHVNFVLFEFSATRLALQNTLVLGVMTATAGTAIALLVSYLVARRSVAGASLLGYLATAPVAIPGIVLGVGLFLSYSSPPFMLYGTIWILFIAFLTIEMPAGYQQLSSAFKSIHPELEEASRILGATRMMALRQITAPLLRTSVVATWCFVFIGTIRELSATILLTTAETKLVSVIIYDLNESGDLGAISVLGLLLLGVSFAIVLLANRLPVLGGRRITALR